MFPKRLRLEILLVLAAKAVGLVFLYLVFVSPVTGPEPDSAAMQSHFLAAEAP